MTRHDPQQLSDLFKLRSVELQQAHVAWLEAERDGLALETRRQALTDLVTQTRDALKTKRDGIETLCQRTFSIRELRPLQNARRGLEDLLEQRKQQLLTLTTQVTDAHEVTRRRQERYLGLKTVVEALQAQMDEVTSARLKKRNDRDDDELERLHLLKKERS